MPLSQHACASVRMRWTTQRGRSQDVPETNISVTLRVARVHARAKIEQSAETFAIQTLVVK